MEQVCSTGVPTIYCMMKCRADHTDHARHSGGHVHHPTNLRPSSLLAFWGEAVRWKVVFMTTLGPLSSSRSVSTYIAPLRTPRLDIMTGHELPLHGVPCSSPPRC